MKTRQDRNRPRNQRLSSSRQRRQQHLLDVKVRSRTASQHRNRRVLVVVSQIALAIALCAGVYLGGRAAVAKFFFDNPEYRLTDINVQTDGALQRDEVLATANIHEGVNIFRVNLSRVQARLQQLPQVDEVQVVRKLPSQVSIRIIERKPVAWITTEKHLADPFSSEGAFLVDGRGVLMKEKKLLPEYLGLPLISGCASESLEAGKIVESFEAKKALELLRLSTRSFMQTRFQIREIDASKGYCLVVTDKTRTRVTVGLDDMETQLQRLEQFLIYSDDSKRELATVNLMVQRNIPVTFDKPAVDVINDTVDPNEEPRVMRAIPVRPFTSPAPSNNKAESGAGMSKARASATPTVIRKAIPVRSEKKKKEKN